MTRMLLLLSVWPLWLPSSAQCVSAWCLSQLGCSVVGSTPAVHNGVVLLVNSLDEFSRFQCDVFRNFCTMLTFHYGAESCHQLTSLGQADIADECSPSVFIGERTCLQQVRKSNYCCCSPIASGGLRLAVVAIGSILSWALPEAKRTVDIIFLRWMNVVAFSGGHSLGTIEQELSHGWTGHLPPLCHRIRGIFIADI